MYYSSIHFPHIITTLFLFILISFLNPFHVKVDAVQDFTTTFFLPQIIAKSEVDTSSSGIILDHKLDGVHLDNLRNTVNDLSSFYTRHTESEFIDDVAYWLTEKLRSICDTDVYIQNFTFTPEKATNEDDDNEININNSKDPFSYSLENIVCEKPGLTNNTIMISAHYDSRMDINNSTARAPGADDKASGVSALLEVARILSNVTLNHGIIFVLFSGEEQGKWGSTYYTDMIDKTVVGLDLLINLDMIGFSSQGSNDFLIEYDNGNAVQDNDKYSQTVATYIKGIASKYTNLNATLGVLGNTDHLPFEALGYTVIGFHDDGVTRNQNYHTMNDTPDTLNYQYMASTTKLVLATILRFDKLMTT